MDEPPSKRQRPASPTADSSELNELLRRDEGAAQGNITNSDEEVQLEAFIDDDGDEFVTENQIQEAEARRKRELRRKRLAQLHQSQDETISNGTLERATSETELNIAPLQNERFKTPDTKQSRTEDASIDLDSEDRIRAEDADSDDGFDMFSSSVSPIAYVTGKLSSDPSATHSTLREPKGYPAEGNRHEQADWDDAEGYYKATIGEIVSIEPPPNHESTYGFNNHVSTTSIKFRVAGVIGKGVFSTVLKCSTLSNSSSVELPPIIALKCVRHNDTMAKAALKELDMLLRLKGSPGVVPLLLPTTTAPMEYRGHVLLVFSFMDYNLRDVLQKFGKGVGLSLQAVRSYCGQLLAALTQLKRHGILHCDLKPDNILVSSDFGVCQIADFGSAVEANSPENMATPYLVSRFYRAPEVILGIQPSFAMDLWSVAVTVVELYLGDVLFRGQTNNDMLFTMMQHLGAIPNRIIRQHLVQAQRIPNIFRHFQQDGPHYAFVQQTMDPVTHANVIKVRPLSSVSASAFADKFPNATPLSSKILKARSASDRRGLVKQFIELMTRCLAMDPSRRIELRDALRHEFFTSSTVVNTG